MGKPEIEKAGARAVFIESSVKCTKCGEENEVSFCLTKKQLKQLLATFVAKPDAQYILIENLVIYPWKQAHNRDFEKEKKIDPAKFIVTRNNVHQT